MSTPPTINASVSGSFKILLVDDAEAVRLRLKQILEPTGAIIVEAPDGAAALEACKNNKDINTIICDLNMPVMDGLTFLENLNKQWPAASRKPNVVMLTSEHRLSAVSRGKELGVSGWIIKPPPPQALLKLIEKFKNT